MVASDSQRDRRESSVRRSLVLTGAAAGVALLFATACSGTSGESGVGARGNNDPAPELSGNEYDDDLDNFGGRLGDLPYRTGRLTPRGDWEGGPVGYCQSVTGEKWQHLPSDWSNAYYDSTFETTGTGGKTYRLTSDHHNHPYPHTGAFWKEGEKYFASSPEPTWRSSPNGWLPGDLQGQVAQNREPLGRVHDVKGGEISKSTWLLGGKNWPERTLWPIVPTSPPNRDAYQHVFAPWEWDVRAVNMRANVEGIRTPDGEPKSSLFDLWVNKKAPFEFWTWKGKRVGDFGVGVAGVCFDSPEPNQSVVVVDQKNAKVSDKAGDEKATADERAYKALVVATDMDSEVEVGGLVATPVEPEDRDLDAKYYKTFQASCEKPEPGPVACAVTVVAAPDAGTRKVKSKQPHGKPGQEVKPLVPDYVRMGAVGTYFWNLPLVLEISNESNKEFTLTAMGDDQRVAGSGEGTQVENLRPVFSEKKQFTIKPKQEPTQIPFERLVTVDQSPVMNGQDVGVQDLSSAVQNAFDFQVRLGFAAHDQTTDKPNSTVADRIKRCRSTEGSGKAFDSGKCGMFEVQVKGIDDREIFVGCSANNRYTSDFGMNTEVVNAEGQRASSAGPDGLMRLRLTIKDRIGCPATTQPLNGRHAVNPE